MTGETPLISGIEQFVISSRQVVGEEPPGSMDLPPPGADPALADLSAGRIVARRAPGEPPATPPPDPDDPPGPPGVEGEMDDDDPPEGWQPRFKSHQEAEKGYSNLLSRVTRAEQKAAEASKKFDQWLESQARAEQDALKEQKAIEAAQGRTEFTNKAYEEVINKIDGLDPEDPEYNKKVSRLWADAHLAVSNFRPETDTGGPDSSRSSGTAAPHASATSPAAGGKPPATGHEADNPPDIGSPEPEKVIEYTRGYLKEQQADFDDTDPAFVYFASQAPAQKEDGTPYSLNEQIDLVIRQVRGHYDAITKKSRQRLAQPMGRGGAGEGAGGERGGPPQKTTISGALDKVADARRIR